MMKTLDEVIDGVGECAKYPDCPLCMYGGQMCMWIQDALHYLKEYRTDLEDNPPLSWDELQQMKYKPVWIECFRPEDKYIYREF